MQSAEQKLDLLISKMDFIEKLNVDFENFVCSQVTELHNKLDANVSRLCVDGVAEECIAHVKELLEEHNTEIQEETVAMADVLGEQRLMITSLRNLEDKEKQQELVELLAEKVELPSNESLEDYRKRILTLEVDRRKGFKEYVDEIAQAIDDGELLELEAFLEEQKESIEGDDEDFQCDDGECDDESCLNCGDDDLDEEQLAEMFKSVQKPFFGGSKDKDAQSEDADDTK